MRSFARLITTAIVLVAAACESRSKPICPDPVPVAACSCPVCETAAAIPLDLPKSAAGDADVVVSSITIDAHGAVTLDGKPMADDKALVAALSAHDPTNARVVIQADPSVTHGKVVHLLDVVKSAGISKIAFAVAKP